MKKVKAGSVIAVILIIAMFVALAAFNVAVEEAKEEIREQEAERLGIMGEEITTAREPKETAEALAHSYNIQ